jgi:PAS domain S-box-containing protein
MGPGKTNESTFSHELHFRGMMDQMLEGVQIISHQWKYLYVNDALVKQGGYTWEQLNGHTMMEMYPGLEQSPVFASLRECMTTRMSKHFETEFTFPDGKVTWFELHIQPIPEGIFVLSIDITSRKLAEEKVKASENEYRSLIDQATDAIFISNGDGRYTEVNESACRLLGYSKEELLKLSVRDLLGAEEVASAPPRFDELRQGHSILSNRSLKAKDGRLIPVEINGKMLSNGKMLGMVRDVSERKANEERIFRLNEELERMVADRTIELENKIQQLKESEEKFQKAFESSAAGITIVRIGDARFLDVNEAFAKIVGYSKQELVGSTAAELNLVTEMPDRDAIIKQLKEVGFVRDIEMIMRSKAGKRFDVLVSIDTIHLHNEPYAINVIYDISQRKEAERQLELVNKELESFSYSVSHDLRAPLRSILGYTHFLNEGYSSVLDAEGNRLIATITRNADKMNRLIDELLRFARLGRQEMEKVSVDFNSMVHGVIQSLGDATKNAEITVKPLPKAVGDPELLTQVWTNLISNAIKYSSKKEKPHIEIASLNGDTETVFYIKDNGAGFDIRFADRLFEVFQRMHSPKDFEGTGIGLSIVKRIVNRHGGRVWADAKVNEGATFYFTLTS